MACKLIKGLHADMASLKNLQKKNMVNPEHWMGVLGPNEATKTSSKPSLKLTANAPENRGPLESRRFLLETTIFGCENVSFREGIKTHIPTYNRFLQQSLVPWFLQVTGKLGSSKIGSCYHWNPLNPYLLKVFEISMTDFKNQCVGWRYPTISHLSWNPFANWS